MKKEVALVLGAGGARGFCHIGVIEVLQENNIPIHVITGCSMGALVGGALAAGISTQKMREVTNRINNLTVFDIDLIQFHKQGGFAKGNRAMSIYKRLVGEKLIEECEVKFATIAADIVGQELHVFKTGPLWKAVRASMSIPAIFQPVRDNGKVLVDGGILKRMPISEARDLGAKIVIAVDAIGHPPRNSKIASVASVFELAYHMIDWRAAQHEGKDADILIEPDMGDKSTFKFKDNEVAIQAGRDAATKALPQILKLLKIKTVTL